MDEKLLSLLVCPETKQALTEVSSGFVERVNQKIGSGTLANRGGQSVEELIEGGLLRDDGKYFYPVREDIPIMLIDEAIAAEEFSEGN